MDFLHVAYKNFIENVDKRLTSWVLIHSSSIVPMIVGIYIILLLVNGGWYRDIFIYCVPVTYSTDPASMKIASGMWWTLILKIVDLIETEIFVLRKKNSQITFLHVYHHISTVLLIWLGVRYFAGGMACFLPLVNCSIHVIMYTYYFLSSLGPEIQKLILPYKPILTITQMVQFVVLLLHLIQAFLPSCNVPKLPVFITFINIIINFLLFYNFYQKNYKNPKLLEGSWWALLTKLVDLIETGIFILRKKNRQISFLHLYHHVSTVLLGWMFGKYYADGMVRLVQMFEKLFIDINSYLPSLKW
ncbi:hypothetical protein HZH68_000165 [Vespula germanica]|uniref:Elongation of very long chain fatty acids protein n=1 Tax=Vespula germanica TaxID=30212 RepID=A0A834U5R9_VESGE|nr:hypothetical protein HZH68_000165 [Vespula germanica]